MSITQAVIVCGGLGTRLAVVAQHLPKCMVPIRDKPMLAHCIGLLRQHGVNQFILAAGHKADVIEDYFRRNPQDGVEIYVSIEDKPLGTAGSLNLIRDRLHQHFLLLYGDVYADFDVTGLVRRHAERSPVATLVVRQSDHPWDSHMVETDGTGRVRACISNQVPGKLYKNQANAAIYALSKTILDFIPTGQASDFGIDVFARALKAGAYLESHVLEPNEFVKDMGTPDRLAKVVSYLRQQEETEWARRNRGPINTIFLDRDGVLNRHVGLLSRPEQLEVLQGVSEAVEVLSSHGMKNIIVTNQPAIARGLCDVTTLDVIHEKLKRDVGAAGGRIDAIYYCPHHPETHHGEGVRDLRRACECRKPNIGMIMQAAQEMGLDLGRAVIIGDSANDIIAGHRAGLRTILIGEYAACQDKLTSPDYRYRNLLEAAKAIVAGRIV